MLDQLTHESFTPYLNSTFTVHYDGSETMPLTLISVDTLGHQPEPGSGQRWSFAITLHSSLKDQYLIQQIYTLEHPELKQMELFLVPLGPDANGMRYEAVFT